MLNPRKIFLSFASSTAVLRTVVLVVTVVSVSASSSSSSCSTTTTTLTRVSSLPTKAWIQTRRILNFSNLFGSSTNALPYDRIAGHPVFSITTPYGSPYMNMEKLSDLNEIVQAPNTKDDKNTQSISEEQNEVRTVALYFMDPDDALAIHCEMKQLEQMSKADIRITSFSLAKALRQATNFGNGLVTGMPPDPLTGNFNDQGSLRYKIVPSKRQLYYAARCVGKERVGLFGDTDVQDAQMAVMGNSAIEGMNLARRREKRERKTPKKQPSYMAQRNAHMEGYTGIPVFMIQDMKRKRPFRFFGVKYEIPMFFNYEDLLVAWDKVKTKNKPSKPTVEVFNLWDLLTSMDRHIAKNPKFSWSDPLKSIRARFTKTTPDLEHITFVPSSRSVEYKEYISARGNGKARLRPMR